MKGLFLSFGLVIALFVSDVQASIYDDATYQTPKQSSVRLGDVNFGDRRRVTAEDAVEYAKEALGYSGSFFSECIEKTGYASYRWVIVATDAYDANGNIASIAFDRFRDYDCDSSEPDQMSERNNRGYWFFREALQSSTCPPDSFPNYVYDVDVDGDGQIDKCYNPLELDNLSQCASQYNSGSMLLVGSNTASTLCKTDSSTGARCAYSLTATSKTTFYTPNLEVSCFGNGELPEYNEDDSTPQPSDEQCTPYGSGYVCQADPKNYCENEYSCVDGCGYVNDQFVCFRDQECTGDECAPAPVDCTNTPDAPVCKDQPDKGTPTYCDTNPTAPTCQAGSNYCKTYPTAPSCQTGTGTGGGSSFNLDYERLAQSMKDAAKTLIDEMPTPDFADTQTEIDNKTGELDEDIDNFMDGEHFNAMTQKIKENIFDGKFQLPSGGSCTAFTLGEYDFDICDVAQRIRSLLYFVFAFLTMIYLKNLFYHTVTPRKE